MAKDKYHDLVRAALENEGWRITHDPYRIKLGKRRGYIDLGAEKPMIAAEKGGAQIAVEVKSFVGHSDLDDFEDALGQFLIYWRALKVKESGRELYLAVPKNFYARFFDDAFFIDTAQYFDVKMVIFNEKEPIIEKWIEYKNTKK